MHKFLLYCIILIFLDAGTVPTGIPDGDSGWRIPLPRCSWEYETSIEESPRVEHETLYEDY